MERARQNWAARQLYRIENEPESIAEGDTL
jgi:hypothetical protein